MTDGLPVPDLAHGTGVEVGVSGGSYEVVVGSGLLARLPTLLPNNARAHRYAVISDENVAPLYGSAVLEALTSTGVDARLYSFPPGEASKTRENWSMLTDAMLDDGHGRDSCVVAVGGGVTGDLAGFVASTYLRGIPVVQVPTSYLAMIDASVGGKTGVDVRAGKNLVGSFHAPRAVFADSDTLATLPDAERVQGLVEAFKHGAILDAAYLEWLTTAADMLLAVDTETATEAIVRSVRIKADVVTRDEREGGVRQVLNFGHTVGHALEAATGYAMGHGTAVAAGMLLEAELGERLGITEGGTRAQIASSLSRLGLSLDSVPSVDLEAAMGFLASDKKARSGRPRYVLLRRLGEVEDEEAWSREIPDSLVRDVLAEIA
ncbi:MAG TPA: 3-dehydroquinate synthase [Gemmatimonadetes bacterium]|nr:3-dehydroquinate synthase [Gemmatimonadota bacterium]